MIRDEQCSAFTAALISSLPQLRRYAIALSGTVSVADDLVQDCVERALKRADTLHDVKHIAGWLRSILFNLFMDMVRLQRSRGLRVDVVEVENDLAFSAPAEDRGATIDFMRALNGLTPEHRQILLLVGLEGLSYSDISRELAIPIGTVMSRLARARERLRNGLEKEHIVTPVERKHGERRIEP